MFISHPRPKKNLLQPPPKKRKTVHKVEEVTFDKDARAEYLSGFHKRKLARIKHAKEVAATKEREEKIEMRKQIREERKREVEEHVQHIHRLLREVESAGQGKRPEDDSEEEWDGLSEEEAEVEEPIDHEEEYIDEGRHTVVTVEAVSVDREGLYKPLVEESDDEEEGKAEEGAKQDESKDSDKKAKEWPKKKKKKFRYETKLERRLSEKKQKARNVR